MPSLARDRMGTRFADTLNTDFERRALVDGLAGHEHLLPL